MSVGAEVAVTLPKAYAAAHGADILQDLAKYCLYMRNQISCPFDQLKAASEELKAQHAGLSAGGGDPSTPAAPHNPKRRRARSAAERRLDKFVSTVDLLLSHLGPALFGGGHQINEALVILGASPGRPKEVFQLVFPEERPPPPPAAAAAGPSGKQDPAEEEEARHALDIRVRREGSKRLIRALVDAAGALPDGGASRGPTKMHILVRGLANQGAPRGFLPKRSFQLPTRRGKVKPVVVRLVPALHPQPGRAPSPNRHREDGGGGGFEGDAGPDLDGGARGLGGGAAGLGAQGLLSHFSPGAGRGGGAGSGSDMDEGSEGEEVEGAGREHEAAGELERIWYLCSSSVKGYKVV